MLLVHNRLAVDIAAALPAVDMFVAVLVVDTAAAPQVVDMPGVALGI